MAKYLGRARNLVLISVILTATLGTVFGFSCSSKESSKSTDSVVVAWSPFENGTLLWIADEQKFFSRHGLNIDLRKYDVGAASLDAVLNSEVDVTFGVTEFPVVVRAFKKSRARILGAVSRVEQLYLVGRKDRGIEKFPDLKGKKVGTTRGTIAEFYLGRFLELNSMIMQDITLVDLKTPAEWENAVAEGVVDAVVTAQPYADLARKRVGDNAVFWPAQGGQHIFGLLVSSDEWVGKNPETIDRFLKSLAQAEEFVIRNPSEAKSIFQKRINVDTAFVESAWARDQFSLSLDQSLVTAMEDQARWMIKNKLTTETQVPDFLDYIYEDRLKAIKPQAVNIIR